MLKNKMNRRSFLQVAAAGAVSALIASCAPKPTPTVAPTAKPAEPAKSEPTAVPAPAQLTGKITWMTQGNFEDPASTSYVHKSALALLAKYKEQQPGVEIELVPAAAEDTWNWIKQQAIAGALPDVVYSWNLQMYWDTKLFYDFQEVLNLPNPYSTNKTWKEDLTVGEDFVAGQLRGPGGAIFVVGMPLWGATNQIVVYYNMDMMKQAGVEKIVPTTYAEWMDQLKKLKDAGFVPFYPGAGARNHFIRLYIQNLAEDLLYTQIDHPIDDQDIGQPDGIVSLKEGAWATKKDMFTPAKNGAFRDGLKLIKDQVPYWNEDWLSPADTAAGNPWVLKQVASEWNHGPARVEILRADPNMDFEWGTFALPPITQESSSLGTGTQVRALGGSSGTNLRLDLPWMIPQTTIKNGKLDLVLDYLHFMTGTDGVKYWNENAQPKGWDPTKQKFEEVFPDPVYQRELYGHYIPNPRGKDGQSIIWDQFTDQGFQVADLYFADQINLDDCISQLEDIWRNNVNAQIQEHAEWKADTW